MAAEYKNADLNKIARDAERDLSSEANVKGHSTSDSARESGVDEAVTNKFPGSTVQYGSEATGRKIPLSEGGDINPVTGQLYKDRDFAHGGVGAPEARDQKYAENQGGNDDVRGNIRN